MSVEKWVEHIVEEVRRVRQEYAAQFEYDLAAIFDHVQKHEEEARKQGAVFITEPLRHASNSADQPAA